MATIANARSTVFLVALVLATTGLAGCIGDEGADLGANATEGNTVIELGSTDAPSALAHVGFELDGVFAHQANATDTDGYFPLDLASERADVIAGGNASTFTVASGDLPDGSYDTLLFRLKALQAHGADAMGDHGDHEHEEASDDGHDHGDSDGHDHGDAEGHDDEADASESSDRSKLSVTNEGVDVPVEVPFTVTEDIQTTIKLVLDAEASTENGTFEPTFATITIQQDGEVVETLQDVTVTTGTDTDTTLAQTPPPVARVSVFGPEGDKIYEPEFDAKNDEFVNSKSSAFPLGAELRFSGTQSEAVAEGATIASYSWDFDDGNTSTGTTVSHSYETPGVFEVALTVEDSEGVTDNHVVRVVVLGTEWTASLVETSFEDGADGWEASSNGDTTWELDGVGHNGSTSWHVGHHAAHVKGSPAEGTGLGSMVPGYTGGAEATLKSPSYTIPETWSNAGFELAIAGASEAGFDQLTVAYTAGNSSTTIGAFSGSEDWTVLGELDALASHVGEDVQFTFTFTSDGAVEQGEGWYVDDFTIGGVDLPLHKAHLLEEGGHDGHDHEH